jgi:Domain of unknown function (DUF4192)
MIMNSQQRPHVRVASPAGLLAVIPYLLGFHPSRSLVVVGLGPPHSQVKLAFRYDLPDPPNPQHALDIAGHTISMLTGHRLTDAVAVGYGPGPLVTPVARTLLDQLPAAGINLGEFLRAEHGRYWSYRCADPACCPADGVPFDETTDPAAAALTVAGQVVLPDRAALAATIAPPTGPAAKSIRAAARRAENRARQLTTTAPDSQTARRLLAAEGRSAVAEAITAYRDGETITSDDQIAWLALTLQSLPVRDDAWARMDPAHTDAHRRLWTDVIRRAPDRYVPAPASLLAFTAWQSGEGALANIALDRALAADPAYSMALLLRQALDCGLPPSQARLPMTPDEVAASYATSLGQPESG